MAKTLKWESIDAMNGVVEAAVVGAFKVYVYEDGTWVIVEKKSRRVFRRSNHRTRGTNLQLGKDAVVAYMNTYFIF